MKKILMEPHFFKNVFLCVVVGEGGGVGVGYFLVRVECFALKFIANLAFPCERRFNGVYPVCLARLVPSHFVLDCPRNVKCSVNKGLKTPEQFPHLTTG